MTTFSLDEEIIGLPLYVPSGLNFFEIEDAALPNGDACLVVRGDLDEAHRAIMPAPVMSPVDICNTTKFVLGQEWSMSVWINLKNLASFVAPPRVMLGCSTYEASNIMVKIRNLQVPFMLATTAANALGWYVEPCMSSVGSPTSYQAVLTGFSTNYMQDRWVLLTITNVCTGTVGNYTFTSNVFFDTYEDYINTSNSTSTTVTGAYGSPRYLHLGAQHYAGKGRQDSWKMAKWTFHDHALTRADRVGIWQAMMGTAHTYTDDFNRASADSLWQPYSGGTIFPLSGNKIVATGTYAYFGNYTKDLGSSNMYSQIKVSSLGTKAAAMVRSKAYGASYQHYSAGWSTINNRWEIDRTGTVIANTTSSTPTLPFTCRLESETISGNVELRLYYNGSLILTTTDSSGSKILVNSNAGLSAAGKTSGGVSTADIDDFECGTL